MPVNPKNAVRGLSLLACASLALLTACGNPHNGYYDENGNFIRYNDTPFNTAEKRPHSSPLDSNGVPYKERDRYYDSYRDYRPYYADRPYRPSYYDRMGYYDSNGNYVSNGSVNVPRSMMPPSGMCRVWFISRPAADQPPVESCNGIRDRVPDGAYVIYGG